MNFSENNSSDYFCTLHFEKTSVTEKETLTRLENAPDDVQNIFIFILKNCYNILYIHVYVICIVYSNLLFCIYYYLYIAVVAIKYFSRYVYIRYTSRY